MLSYRTLLFVCSLLAISIGATAQELIWHETFDGSSGAELHVRENSIPPVILSPLSIPPVNPEVSAPAPVLSNELNAGRVSAMHFNGQAVIARPFSLDLGQYPQVTVTAWVRQDAGVSGSRTVLSSGGGGFSIGVNGGRLAVKAGSRGHSFKPAKVPEGQWVFIAGVVDVQAGTMRIHQDQIYFPIDNFKTKVSSPRQYANPNDAAAEKQEYLFVGASNFHNWSGSDRPLYIGDVRVYAGALSVDQIEEIRLNTRSNVMLPGDQFGPTQLPGDQFEPTQLPGDQFEPTQLPGDQFEPTQLPGDQFEPTQLPGDQFEPTQLPGDQFEPTQLPGDQFEPTQLPGDQFEPPQSSSLADVEIDKENLTDDYFVGEWCVSDDVQSDPFAAAVRSLKILSPYNYENESRSAPGVWRSFGNTLWYNEQLGRVYFEFHDIYEKPASWGLEIKGATVNSLTLHGAQGEDVVLHKRACTATEGIDRSRINRDYFVGTWDVGHPGQIGSTSWSFDFRNDGTLKQCETNWVDIGNSTPGSVPTCTVWNWLWPPDALPPTIGLSELPSVNSPDPLRSLFFVVQMSTLTNHSFIWQGEGNSMTLVRRASETSSSTDGPTLAEIQQDLQERNAINAPTGISNDSPTNMLEGYEAADPAPADNGEQAPQESGTPRYDGTTMYKFQPTGPQLFSETSGNTSPYDVEYRLELGSEFLGHIRWYEKNDRPCHFEIRHWLYSQTDPEDSTVRLMKECPLSGNDGSGKTATIVGPHGLMPIRGIRVCDNDRAALNTRLKGIWLFGGEIDSSGDGKDIALDYRTERPNCRDWQAEVRCPGSSLATGIILHSRRIDDRTVQVRGAQLICRQAGPRESL